MDSQLQNDVTRRLLADYEFRESGNAQGRWLRHGRCPQCGKRELYTSAESPWVVKCPRINKCGWEGHVKDLYPDLFESWSDRYQSTPKSPTAAADAYLRFARGFDVDKIKGWYTQEHYHDPKTDAGTATVRFPLPDGCWWERFIDAPRRFGAKKARFPYGKTYKGQWWCPPALDLAGELPELWIVEGIFDAIALWLHGLPAVAAMSSNNYPDTALEALAKAHAGDLPVLVWALDGDKAGRSFTRKHVERATAAGWDCKAAQIPQRDRSRSKIDWNDLHQRDRLSEKDLDEYRYRGDLLLAKDATETALLIYQRKGRPEFPFEHGHRVYWFKLDLDRYRKAMEKLEQDDDGSTEHQRRTQALAESNAIVEIANCQPFALYYQANTLTDEAWYYFRITFPHDGQPIKNTFTSSQLSAAAEFKKRLMHIAPGAMFTGSGNQLDRLMKPQLFGIKRVETIDFIGYSKAHAVYVFGELAVKDGKIYELNEEDYFDVGPLAVKTLNQSVSLQVNRDRQDYRTDWLPLVWQCFGANGIIALAFWLGTLFAEQIRDLHKSYPFLEVIGEAGAGKSTLLEFLWKLVGRRDYEGFDPSKATLAARARNFAQVSNLPVVLIEADRSDVDTVKVRQFDWDELKTAYNGRSVRSRGLKNSGNETYEPPFRGAIVISQNAPVQASDAVLQRICHLRFDRSNHSPENKHRAEQLERMPLESVSGFLLAAVVREKKIMDTLAEGLADYEQMLQGRVKTLRIAKNHALLMALVDALDQVVHLTPEQKSAAALHIIAMAEERQQAINADHPVVAEFWEQFEFMDVTNALGVPRLNHSRDEQLVAVSLPHFQQVATQMGLKVPTHHDLKRHLPSSKSHKFVGRKAVCSAIFVENNTPRTVKCWVFEKPK